MAEFLSQGESLQILWVKNKAGDLGEKNKKHITDLSSQIYFSLLLEG